VFLTILASNADDLPYEQKEIGIVNEGMVCLLRVGTNIFIVLEAFQS
jgi:hypothetical protein